MTAAGWQNGDVVYLAWPDNAGAYEVKRLRTAGGKLYDDIAASNLTHSYADELVARWQGRVDAGMGWQEAERG